MKIKYYKTSVVNRSSTCSTDSYWQLNQGNIPVMDSALEYVSPNSNTPEQEPRISPSSNTPELDTELISFKSLDISPPRNGSAEGPVLLPLVDRGLQYQPG